VRLAEQLVEVLRAAGHTGAELGDDQPQALPVRLAHDVLDEVGRDRRGGVVDLEGVVRQLVLGAAGLAVDVVLADERLLADVAGRVGAERLEAGLGDLRLDDRAGARRAALLVCRLADVALGDAELLGDARGDAADPQVAALGEAERVVERDLDRATARLLVRAREHDRPEAHGEHEGEGCDLAEHQRIGPVARSASRQSSWFCSPASKTFDPSGAGSSEAPGQRLY
jgi:hypothetical protein